MRYSHLIQLILLLNVVTLIPWYEHTQNVIGISCFGESGKGNDLMDHFGFTPEKIIKKIKQMI